ncbi:kinase-like protein [Sodiomyces alkalinus F11]|uniref:non-specific serine/threonine protein kinase n=1 Tax=Sodiomyces alkalinus (strain CBS 110278 / VKM F-3762 / F11) TaxID=1314773 RepID=A0A3N2PVJ9_SODAK|nr:kinase-like protein [Sodiomyces alkalinus F11]ROT38519.1 kinase-like protein [Sodiomyces alkalinus F11]
MSSSETFSERAAMRTALGDAARQAWPNCVYAAAAPDAVIDLDGDAEGRIDWVIRYEPALYQQYLEALSPADSVLMKDASYKYVDHRDLVMVYRLPGRGTSAVVRRVSTAMSKSLYVLKGVDFGDFLTSPDEFTHDRDVFYRAIQILSSMPPHPNILSPPPIIAVAGLSGDEGKALVCGTLYPFMARGTLDDQVTRCKKDGMRLSLRDKARWCLQISSAVAHTHHTAHTYHMDIKPANILVDDQGNTILIDWEQSGAPLYTLAPEANGEWDVDEVGGLGTPSKLVYTQYQGPVRVNLPRGRPLWNVFPDWSKRWPKACEAAEVFSLGRTMWMLLQEVPQEDVEDLDPEGITVNWSEDADDIPDCWKAVVMRCLERDPNERIGLVDLVQFWEGQQQIPLASCLRRRINHKDLTQRCLDIY